MRGLLLLLLQRLHRARVPRPQLALVVLQPPQQRLFLAALLQPVLRRCRRRLRREPRALGVNRSDLLKESTHRDPMERFLYLRGEPRPLLRPALLERAHLCVVVKVTRVSLWEAASLRVGETRGNGTDN